MRNGIWCIVGDPHAFYRCEDGFQLPTERCMFGAMFNLATWQCENPGPKEEIPKCKCGPRGKLIARKESYYYDDDDRQGNRTRNRPSGVNKDFQHGIKEMKHGNTTPSYSNIRLLNTSNSGTQPELFENTHKQIDHRAEKLKHMIELSESMQSKYDENKNTNEYQIQNKVSVPGSSVPDSSVRDSPIPDSLVSESSKSSVLESSAPGSTKSTLIRRADVHQVIDNHKFNHLKQMMALAKKAAEIPITKAKLIDGISHVKDQTFDAKGLNTQTLTKHESDKTSHLRQMIKLSKMAESGSDPHTHQRSPIVKQPDKVQHLNRMIEMTKRLKSFSNHKPST
ncbi:unnamed protein product [Owenia fusiformis]|nr:unnamed protein product [Owenia fusiformis]